MTKVAKNPDLIIHVQVVGNSIGQTLRCFAECIASC